MDEKKIVPYILLLIQPIFMASNLVVARGGIAFVPPISLAFWRWFFVFIILLIFNFILLKKNFQVIKKEFWKLIFLGSMGCGVCGAFPFIAGKTTTIVNMGIFFSTSPIFIILISSFFFEEKINKFKIFGLVSCLSGVLLIIIKGDIYLLFKLSFTKGDLWMLGSAIGWALYSIYLYYWKSKLNVFARFMIISLGGVISLLPFYILEELFVAKTDFNFEFLFWVLFAAISPGIIAFALYTHVQQKLGASITGFTLYLFTVYGAFYGIYLFDEKLENYHYFGTILVFFGIYFVRKKIYDKKT